MSELKKEWYVVNTYAGQENNVKNNLERRVKTMGLEDSLFQVVVAEEKEIDLAEIGKIYIRETKLVDMYAQMEECFESEQFQKHYSHEEIQKQRTDFENNFSKHCPKGKYYAAVEYEAPENISVDIKLKSVLDSPPVPKDSCMGFILGSDLLPVHDGMKVKTAVVDSPLDGDTEIIDAEIFSVYEVKKPEEIKLL